jgi:hypothetical protein
MIKRFLDWYNRPSRDDELLVEEFQKIFDDHKAFITSLDSEQLSYYLSISGKTRCVQ